MACAVLVSACVTPNAMADVWWPGWKAGGEAFVKTIKRPSVWGLAAGAVVFGATNADKAVSDWARDTTPIFNDSDNAKDWSNHLKTLANVGAYGTALAVPENEDTGKLKRVVLNTTSWYVNHLTNRVLKENIDRTRPDGSNENSFPSGHTAETWQASVMASRHMAVIPVSDNAKLAADIGFYTVGAHGGWSRVESGKHFPSDVLMSAAIASFYANWLYDWFITDPDKSSVSF